MGDPGCHSYIKATAAMVEVPTETVETTTSLRGGGRLGRGVSGTGE